MNKFLSILLVCLLIMACKSKSPEQAEYDRKIKEIRNERKIENKEFEKFAKQNSDLFTSNKAENNNRLMTGEEQIEIANSIASRMNQDQRTQSIPIKKVSGVYKNNNGKYSIQFPYGWELRESSAEKGTVVAKSNEDGSSIKVSRENNDDTLPLTLDLVLQLRERYLSQLKQFEPSASIIKSGILRDFGGREAASMLYRLPNDRVFNIFIVPYNKYSYVILFEGFSSAFKSKEIIAVMNSFKI